MSVISFFNTSTGGGGGGGTPGAPVNSIQFNNPLGTFAGSPDFLFDPSTDTVSLGLAGSHTGKLNLNGTTSGIVTLSTQDAAGTWTMKLPTTAGTNTFVLTTDGAGNTSWGPSGGTTVTPLPQFNPIAKGTHGTLSSGNSVMTNDGTGGSYATSLSVGGHDGGKWYAEFKDVVATVNGNYFGIGDSATALNTYGGQDSHSWVIFDNFTFVFHNNTTGVSVGTPTTGSVVQIAWDADTGNVWWGINNVWQNAGDPVAETNPCATGVFGYMYLVGGVAFTTGKIAYQALAYAPPQGYSEWGLAGSATKAGLPANSVQYNLNGGMAGAANFNIITGDPNVTAGNLYLYDSAQSYAAQNALQNYYLGPTGNFTATGSGNSAFGSGCLAVLTTGVRNSAEGVNALASVTTGGANVAIGNAALQFNTSGTGNVALGDGALKNLTGGDNNFAMGAAALGSAINIADCIAIGQQALTSETTNGANVAIGKQALPNLTLGAENIALGVAAGVNVSDGVRNTFIGLQSGSAIIHSSNNIIIGYNCDVPLDVNGQLSIGNYIYGTGLTGTGSTISTGKIGIGIKAPSVELDVNGSINVAAAKSYRYNNVTALQAVTASDNWFFANSGNLSNSGTDNISFGNGALPLASSGSSCIAIGANALANATSGDENIAIGPNSMGITTGSQNTAIGSQAMLNATGGSGHLAMGRQSLASNTTGNDNNSIGASALHACTTGSRNSADGSAALAFLTTGSDNVANGYRAGLGMTIGVANVCIGRQAGSAISDGQNNTIIGAFAAPQNVHGNSNIAIGNGVGPQVSDIGDNNILVGTNAGYNLSGSAGNVFIGQGAGGTETTGSRNLCLGDQVDSLPSATASNQMAIMNYIYGTGLSGTGSTISTGKIGIGIKAPNFNLDVAGSLGQAEAANLIHTSVALTNNAAANIATLTNAPAVGNPTKWIAIDDNGTQRFIPAW